MSAPYTRQVQVALLVLLTVTFLGGGNMPRGSGTWIAQAQAGDDKDFDHFACYAVSCIKDNNDKKNDDDDDDEGNKCATEKEQVTLFNQFTDDKDKERNDKGQKVRVGNLKLLCVPTKKIPDHKR